MILYVVCPGLLDDSPDHLETNVVGVTRTAEDAARLSGPAGIWVCSIADHHVASLRDLGARATVGVFDDAGGYEDDGGPLYLTVRDAGHVVASRFSDMVAAAVAA